MTTKQLSLQHLIQLPASHERRNESSLYPAILALHGRGSNERDLIELAPHLPEGLLWICPRAPLFLGTGAYEWYRVRVIGKPDPAQVVSALESVDRFVDEILATYPVDPRRLFLLGFSQGSLLSMCYTLTHPARVAGVMAQSGYIPNSVELEIQEAALKNKPFLLTHGEHDTLIPVEWGRLSRDRLQQLGVDLEYHEFPMGHNVSVESLAVLRSWLEKQLIL
jgi:phospholipase/carboxylesterase